MTIACDISEFQVPVDDRYPHRWLIFRCCDGDYQDPHCAKNAAWSAKALTAGRLDGWTAYVVFRPGRNAAVLAHLAKLPAGGHVMIDAESWGGQIRGDHSAEINQLADALASRYGRDKVWGYGNRGPDLTVWPHKPPWMGWVVASYGGSKPDVPNLIGWQYTDGQPQYQVPGLPSSTSPFGPCDHNQLYLQTGADIVTPDDYAKIAAAVWAEPFHAVKRDLKTPASQNHPAWVFLTNGSSAASLPATIASLSGQIAGLTAAVKQLAGGGQVDLTAVTAAAKSGAQSALDGYTLHIDPPAATP